jgi:hypothetical protein
MLLKRLDKEKDWLKVSSEKFSYAEELNKYARFSKAQKKDKRLVLDIRYEDNPHDLHSAAVDFYFSLEKAVLMDLGFSEEEAEVFRKGVLYSYSGGGAPDMLSYIIIKGPYQPQLKRHESLISDLVNRVEKLHEVKSFKLDYSISIGIQ